MTVTECPCSKSELDSFRPIDVQVAMTDARWCSVYPCQGITTNSEVVEFSIPGTMNEYIDLNHISLYVRGKITKNDKSNLAATNFMHPANNFLHSMIRHIDVSVNGQLITRSTRDYPYKAILQKLTQTDMPLMGNAEGQFIMEGYATDSAGKNIHKAEGTSNPGGTQRRNLIKGSRLYELMGGLAVDFFQCDRLLQPGCDINIKIYMHDPKFYLVDSTAADGDRLKDAALNNIDGMELRVRRVTVAPSFLESFRNEIQLRDAIYPFTRREMLTFTIPKGTTSVTKENLWRGHLGTRFFIGLVDADEYNGQLDKSPFYFTHFKLKEISLQENGIYMAVNPLKVNFTDKAQTAQAYRTLLESIGAIGERALCTPITHDHFCDGNTIFCFTRSPDLVHGMNHLPPQTASLTLQMQFHEATTETIQAICMVEYDSRIQITKDNNVITDFAI